jgi:hypothetical protein
MDQDEPTVQYFALIRDGGTAEEAIGLVRRVHTRPLPTDEVLGNDLEWQPTEYLERYYVLGSTDGDHVEITAELAAQLIDRWRAQAARRG